MNIIHKFGYITAIAGLMIAPAYAQDDAQTDSDIQQDETQSEEQSIDHEIDAELAAELERAEQLNALTDPDEIFKTFSLKKPLIELPVPDPERLIVAEKIVARLYPVGTSERVVRTMMDDMVKPIVNRTLDLNLDEAIELFGIPDDLIPTSEENTERRTKKFGDLIAEMDPKFREKMDIVFEAYSELTGLTSAPIEPALSQAMARDYARKYDLQQLNDLDAFFSTPTGGIFARDFMLSTASIDMVQTALKEFPAIAENSEKIQEVSKRIEDVFKTEPKVEEEEAEESCSEDDVVCEATEEEADVNDALANDLGNEPWFDKNNWDDDTRNNIEQLSDTYNELAELSEQAYTQYDEAFDAAVAESRKQYIADGWTREESEDEIDITSNEETDNN